MEDPNWVVKNKHPVYCIENKIYEIDAPVNSISNNDIYISILHLMLCYCPPPPTSPLTLTITEWAFMIQRPPVIFNSVAPAF